MQEPIKFNIHYLQKLHSCIGRNLPNNKQSMALLPKRIKNTIKYLLIIPIVALLSLPSCKEATVPSDTNILFLHHSTGRIIWNGEESSLFSKILNKLGIEKNSNALIPNLFNEYNKIHNTHYYISEKTFPKLTPYGWNNFPYDYYNIWVKNSEESSYMEEPTLKTLTKEYQTIIFKHCFPVCYIQPDDSIADINSNKKTTANYKLQYNMIKNKLHEFPNTKFILWTGAAQVKSNISEEAAVRARTFFNWVKEEWDEESDNIYLWDFYELETEGDFYLKDEYAMAKNNSHPNSEFAETAGQLFFNRIIDVIENNGTKTTLKGEIVNN